MRLLLTGASGFLGGAIAADIAARGLLGDTCFLVRARTAGEGLERIRGQLRRFRVADHRIEALDERQIICADLGSPEQLRLTAPPQGITHVIHAAALASFSNNPAIWPTNVEGTVGLANWLSQSGRLTRWLQVGTAMSCGPGLSSPVQESWTHGADLSAHLVPYTRSKIAAEFRLRELGVPLVVARPSIVVGHSELGCEPSPSIFWVFRIAFALQRFTCAPDDRIDIIPVDWCAHALVDLCLRTGLEYDLYHVSAGEDACSFREIDRAYAAASGRPPVADTYEQLPSRRLRELVPLFEERLGKINRVLILQALTLYGAFAQLNYTFSNRRLMAEHIASPPRFADYLDKCWQTTADMPLIDQMAYDFK